MPTTLTQITSPRIGRGFIRICAGLTLLAGLAGPPVAAQPSGGQVVAGSASIAGGVGTLTVTQTSARAILTWQDFSIGAGDLVRFVQPDAASATLNRVVSGLPSTLNGRLEANGRVFLINPNGILVGSDARIDTAGFLASTLDVTNQDFLAGGDLHFSGDSTAAIRNLGPINALGGDVFLIARQVENTGTITAANGLTGLAAGTEILLTTGGDERLWVRAASAPGTVVNAGTITAATTELKAAGGNAYALAINNSGTVRATGSAVRDGQLWLVATGDGTVANAGVLDVSTRAGRGGQVVVTGGRVLLEQGARIDASGATGGGTILVLGGMQGGGQVTVDGSLDARASTGAGGFIETSAARVTVTDAAHVTTAAPGGRSGTWLIDPVDFTIAASGGDMTGAAVGTALAGGNFTIQSATGGAGTAGDVNVNDSVTWSANKLTLNAQNNINVNAVMNGSGTASLALEYGQGAVAAGNASTYLVNAAISLPSGSNFSTKLGSDGTVKNFTVITGLGAAGSTTATDLQGMAGNLAGLYALGADIDATATSGWNTAAGFAPIGTTTARFTGTFDGLGHTVSGLTIARPAQNDVGLIGYLGVGGVLRNIRLTGGSVTGMTGTGALLGSNSGSVSYASASTTVSGLKNVGGLVGASLGPITNVSATGNVSNVSGGTGFVGGLVGNSGTGGSITNGWASGNVTATGPNAGGLVGFNSTSVISNTYATGTVSGTTIVGGLVGSVFGNINNSYATGAVTGSSRVGGLVGHIYSGITVSNAYATGSVAGTSLVGGFVGSSDGTVTNSYWDSTVTATGMGSGTGATGRTTTEMKALASFTGFDISGTGGSSAIWRIYEGNTTPWLRVFLTPLTVTANNDTKTYNGTAYSGGNGVTYSVASPSPTPSGSLSFGGTAQSALNAGAYAITASGLFSVQQGYDITYAAGTLTINPANLVLTGTRVYDGSTIFAGSNLTATGVNGETFTVTGAGATGNLTTKNVQTSQLLAGVTGLAVGIGNSGSALSTNYNALSVTGSSVSVTPKTLTITGFASDNKVYNGTTAAVIATAGTLSGVVTGDTVGFSQTGATFDTKDVGTGKTVTLNGVTLTGSGDQTNYTHTATVTDLSDITAATLTYTATPTSRTYGSGNPTLGGTINNFVNGETQATATTGTLTFATTATVTSNVGTYAINGSGLTANNGNYTFTQAAGNATALTINPASLVLTGTRVYDGSTIFAGSNLTATGVNGETFTVTGAGASGNLTTKNVQTNQLLAGVTGLAVGTGNSGTALSTNYNALSVTGSSVSVTPKTLTITGFASDNKVYNGTTAAVIATAGTLSGVVTGDTVGFSQTGATFDTKDVGTGKTVTLNGVTLTGSGDQTNYTHTATVTDLSDITAATLTYTANTASRLYGSANPAFSGAVTGFVNSETQAGVTAGTLAFGSTATTTSNVGTYAINGSGLTANNGNYVFTQAAGNATALTINPASLVLTGTRVYDGSTIFAGSNLTATGVNGETFTVTGAGASGNLSTKNVQTNQPLASVTGLTLGTGNSGSALSTNYNALAVTGSSVSVTPKTLTITGFASDNKVYNGTTAAVIATAGTLSGVVTGDTVGFSQTGATFDTKDVGTGKTVTLNGVTLTGSGDQTNYTHTATVTDLSDITAATLTYTANTANRIFGASDPTFSGAISGFVNSESQGTATTGTMVFTTTATVTSVAGLYPLNGSGLTSNHGNYVFVQAPSNATAFTINPLVTASTPLSITADDKSKLYGAALPAFTASYNGFINGDTPASVTGLQFSTTATMGSNIGTYSITPFGATAPSTYQVNYVPGILTISPALLNILADNKSSVYGATLPAFTASFSGLVNGDTAASVTGLQIGSTAVVGSNVGTYAITPFGATAANYSLVYQPGVLTISPAALTLTAGNVERPFGTANPSFSFTTTGLVNGDTPAVVTGLVFSTPATVTSAVGSYAITPSGGSAPNYSLTYISGLLQVLAPTVVVGTTLETVVLVGQEPAISAEFAVVLEGDRPVLVSVGDAEDNTAPVDERLALTLHEAINPSGLDRAVGGPALGSVGSANALNFGSFEPVSSPGGPSAGVGGGGPGQPPEPGLFRESAVSMGGFNIVYHEAVAEARTQAEGNTALGSSYREFSETDNPQVNMVRAKADRQPSDSTAPRNASDSL